MPLRPNAAARAGIANDGFNHFAGATLTLYTGSQPSAGGGTPSGSAIASGTAPTPAFANSTTGSAALASNWTLTVSNNGTAGFMRMTKGSAIMDMDVGEGSGTLSLDETALTTGGTVTISGGTGLTLPGNDA